MPQPPHPGSRPQSYHTTYDDNRPSQKGSNALPEHPANNSYPGNGAPYYEYEHGHDNAVTRPVARLTDVDVDAPPMPPKQTERDIDITHGRSVVGKVTRPGPIASRPATQHKPWVPKGRDPNYRATAQSRKSPKAGPGGSYGQNTDY